MYYRQIMMENIPAASNVSLANSFLYVSKKEILSIGSGDFITNRCPRSLERLCEDSVDRCLYGKILFRKSCR